MLEIFNGNGGMGEACVRRRLHSGENLDLVAGFDLCNPVHQRHVLNHNGEHKHLVIILAPPCTSFGHWSHLNRVLHPATWRSSRRTGELLVAFAAQGIMLQLYVGRHFWLEDPAGSGIFCLVSFREIWASGRVVAINVPECALGLIVHGQPIYKITTLWASSTSLLKPFQGIRCTHASHGVRTDMLGSVARTKLAQVWPRAMYQRICNGIQMLLRKCRRAHLVHISDVFPLALGRPRGRPRKSPLGAADTKREGGGGGGGGHI